MSTSSSTSTDGVVIRADAPGRANLMGEHTDYNQGFVLPVALPQRTRVELVVRGDDTVRVRSDGQWEGGFELGEEARSKSWLDHVQGVTAVLRRDGIAVPGFEARIESDLPVRSGLGSSAALDVALLRALRLAFDLPLDDMQLALLARRVEAEFVGAPVGLLDPLAASLADRSSALFLDTRSLELEHVPLPAGLELAVIDSAVAHSSAGAGYGARRAECERAASLLGVSSLRELPPDRPEAGRGLPPPLDRRVRHVLTENARVLAMVEALRRSDLAALGPLLAASHASQRDDLQVSIPEIDLLVGLASAEPAVFGARLTGHGFGGSIVALTRAGEAAEVAARIAAAYGGRTGRQARVLVPPSREVTGQPEAHA